MTESQLKDFERYEYIVPLKIKKLAPELADNEDFVQEVYTQLIEYLSNNEGYANLTEWRMFIRLFSVLFLKKEKGCNQNAFQALIVLQSFMI